MEEMRIKKLELAVNKHNLRLDEHDNLLAETRKDIHMLQDIAKSNQEILEAIHHLTDYAKKTYDVFEPIARYGAKIAKVSAAMGAVFVVLWHAIGWVAKKIGMFS